MPVTKEQLHGAFATVQTVAEAIRELKQVPSGLLYTNVMGKIDFEGYEKIINLLKRSGLVREENHLLIWIEPAKE
jgi:ABC-type iron transport system FetAB ATPase subunit